MKATQFLNDLQAEIDKKNIVFGEGISSNVSKAVSWIHVMRRDGVHVVAYSAHGETEWITLNDGPFLDWILMNAKKNAAVYQLEI
jgi:hypothetical protein